MFTWAIGEPQLVPPNVAACLDLVKPLKAGRSQARETAAVAPVEDWAVEATLPHLTSVVGAMVQLQRLTGMRSTEICSMTADAIGRLHEDVWIYACRLHKNRHRVRPGRDPVKHIPLGPRAVAILEPLLKGRAPGRHVFSPAESEAKRRTQAHAQRITPANVGNAPGTNRRDEPQKAPGDAYDRLSYYKAVQYGIEAANKARAAQAAAEGRATWIRVPHWHPHQLRHNAAGCLVEENGDLAAAAAALGHETVRMTEHYAHDVVERIRLAKAIDAARKIG